MSKLYAIENENRNRNIVLTVLLVIALLAAGIYALSKVPYLLNGNEPANTSTDGVKPALAVLTDKKAPAEQHAMMLFPNGDDDCAKFWSQVAPIGTKCVVRQPAGLATYSDVRVMGVFFPNWSNQTGYTYLAFGDEIECPWGCSFFQVAESDIPAITDPGMIDTNGEVLLSNAATSGTCDLNTANPDGYKCQSADVLYTEADVVVNGQAYSGAGIKTLPAGAVSCEFGCYLELNK